MRILKTKALRRWPALMLTLIMVLSVFAVLPLTASAVSVDYTLVLDDTNGTLHKDSAGGENVTAAMTTAGAVVTGAAGSRILTLTDFSFTTSAACVLDIPGGTTIVLNGANTLETTYSADGNTGIIMETGNLTIKGGGSLNITVCDVTVGGSYGIIVLDGNVTISGDASVTVTAGSTAGDDSSGISAFAEGTTIEIKDGARVTATAETSSGIGCGIVSDNIIISGDARVNATGSHEGLCAFNDLTVSGRAGVAATGGSYGITCDGVLTISGGTVTATGDGLAMWYFPDDDGGYKVPSGYKYWVSAAPSNPGGDGTVSNGSFVVGEGHKFAKIETPVIYTIINGGDQIWKKGTATGVTITCDGNFGTFAGVKVDGADILNDKYTAVSGSTVVTLNPAYLETLALGAHKVELMFRYGSVQTGLTIIKADDPAAPPIPNTGDSGVLPWITLCLSAMGLAVLILSAKKRGEHNA